MLVIIYLPLPHADILTLTENWFQNRRAKSKQDAKKTRVVYDKWAIGDPNSADYQQAQCSPTFCDPLFFQLVRNNMARRRQQERFEQARMNRFPQSDTCDVNINTMQPSTTRSIPLGGYLDGEASDADPPRPPYNNLHNYQASVGSYVYRPNPSTPVSQDGGSFVDPIVNGSGNQPMMDSNQLLPISTPTSGPLHPGQPLRYAATEADAMLNLPLRLTDGAHWPPEENAANLFGVLDDQPDFTITNTGRPQQPPSLDMQGQHLDSLPLTESQPLFTGFEDPAIFSNQFDGDIQQSPRDDHFSHRQSVQTEHVQHVPGMPVAGQLSVASMDSGRQDNSRAFALADSSGATEIPPLPRHGPAFRFPRTNPSIAARRHRRPAALGGAAFRSASYADALPPSPSTMGTLPASDPTLRRITSNGFSGVGRIQTPNQGLAQPSPLNMASPDATTTPTGSWRQVSNGSTSTTASIPSFAASLAPPTPLSPYETASDRPYMDVGYSGRLLESSQSGLSWNHALGNMASPPATPLNNVDQAMQISLQGASLIDAQVTHSAPAWQQTFPMSPPEAYGGLQHVVGMPQVQADHETSPTYRAPLNGPIMAARQMSMPSVMPVHGSSMQDAGAQPYSSFESTVNSPQVWEMAHHYHGLPFQQPQSGGGMLHHQGYPMALQLATPPAMQTQTLSASTSTLFVEWSPPQGSTPPPRLTQAQPRNYTFANCGPEAFSNP